MNLRYLRWLLLGCVPLGFVLPWIDSRPVGLPGDVSLPDAVAAFAATVVFGLLLTSAPPKRGSPVEGVSRRAAAFLVDGLFLATMSPGLAVMAAVVTHLPSGTLAGVFVLLPANAGDIVISAIVAALAAGFPLLYFALPLARGKPTPGTCVMGYVVVRDDGARLGFAAAIKRTLLAVVGLMVWPVALFGWQSSRGKFWWDRVLHTGAVRWT